MMRRLAPFALSLVLLASPASVRLSAEPSTAAAGRDRTAVVQSSVSYTATRLLVARSEKLDRLGWLEAETTFQPGRGLTYTILREGGDKGIRNRVLRKVLENEVEMSAPGRAARMAISEANYQLVRAGAQPTVRLSPLRKETTLIDGTAIVDARGRLVRVQGRLAKSPSFWVRSVRIERTYQPIAGHALPVHVESTADVRLAGPCEFAMWIDYTSVDGRRVHRAATRPHPTTAAPSPLLVALQQRGLR
jgi:hypothetical protein